MRTKLEACLRQHAGIPSRSAPVTFGDLYLATGIALYVVTLDVVTGSPVIFSYHRHQTVPVADAVIASSSLPLVFEPAYASAFIGFENGVTPVGAPFKHDRGRAIWTHGRFVDGGAWENLPTSVFTDARLRVEFGLAPLPKNQRVVSFVLRATPPAGRPVNVVTEGHPAWDTPPMKRIRRTAKPGRPPGTKTPLRLRGVVSNLVAVSAALIVLIVFAVGLLTLAGSGTPALQAVAAVVVFIALVSWRLAGQARRSLLPLLAAVLGTHTRPPSWLGTENGEWVLFLGGNDWIEKVDTTSFKVRPKLIDSVIKESKASATEQIQYLKEHNKTLLLGNLEKLAEAYDER